MLAGRTRAFAGAGDREGQTLRAYLPKPYRDESLVAVIRTLLRVNDAG